MGLGDQEARILMLGLDAAGKTTILYKVRADHWWEQKMCRGPSGC